MKSMSIICFLSIFIVAACGKSKEIHGPDNGMEGQGQPSTPDSSETGEASVAVAAVPEKKKTHEAKSRFKSRFSFDLDKDIRLPESWLTFKSLHPRVVSDLQAILAEIPRLRGVDEEAWLRAATLGEFLETRLSFHAFEVQKELVARIYGEEFDQFDDSEQALSAMKHLKNLSSELAQSELIEENRVWGGAKRYLDDLTQVFAQREQHLEQAVFMESIRSQSLQLDIYFKNIRQQLAKVRNCSCGSIKIEPGFSYPEVVENLEYAQNLISSAEDLQSKFLETDFAQESSIWVDKWKEDLQHTQNEIEEFKVRFSKTLPLPFE